MKRNDPTKRQKTRAQWLALAAKLRAVGNVAAARIAEAEAETAPKKGKSK